MSLSVLPREFPRLLELHEIVKAKMEGYQDASHDFEHVQRVLRNADVITTAETKDQSFDQDTLLAIYLTALLHDMFDHKCVKDMTREELKEHQRTTLSSLLEEKGFGSLASRVCNAIEKISFSSEMREGFVTDTWEAKIAQDSDRLDAIGAIGAARAFAYGGLSRRPFYYDGSQLDNDDRFFAMDSGCSLGHFPDKLLKLSALMKTSTGKSLAAQRHAFLEQFILAFRSEAVGFSPSS